MVVPSADIPQANSLKRIRELVAVVASGQTERGLLGEPLGLSPRHVDYYIAAARILGCIDDRGSRLAVEAAGAELLATRSDSLEEASYWRRAFGNVRAIRDTVGDLMSSGVTQGMLADALLASSELTTSTAKRRAAALFAWRRHVLSIERDGGDRRKGTAPGEPDADTDPGEIADVDIVPLPSNASAQGVGDNVVDTVVDVAEEQLSYVRDQMEKARFVLFTGAGFSFDALDMDGRRLPLASQLANEIWSLAFPDELKDDGSSLPDIFAAAKRRKHRQLETLLSRRLRADSARLADHYRTWFSMPWLRCYTLNVDDVEEAAARKFDLPREPKGVLGTAQTPLIATNADQLPVVHLNGAVAQGMDSLTFSAYEYAERLAGDEPWYSQLSSDLLAYPFVFVGTVLEEPLLWQHLALRGQRERGTRERRPRSFLVAPSLPRAKQIMLSEYNVTWIKATTEQFAARLLEPLQDASRAGHQRIAKAAQRHAEGAANIERVAEAIANAREKRSLFLMGAEPTWSDLVAGRAIVRTCDEALISQATTLLSESRRNLAPILVIAGTAGTGKSTSAMHLARELSASGHDVGWIGTEFFVTPSELRKYLSSANAPTILAIDDVDRYGQNVASMIRDWASYSRLRLLVVATRSSKLGSIDGSTQLASDQFRVWSMPNLEDTDIADLVQLLEREHKIGVLRGKPRHEQEEAFRRQSGRQLLVAMIRATQGKELEEKVFEEWEELPSTQREFYAFIAIATALRFSVDRELLLLAAEKRTTDAVDAIALLVDRNIVSSLGTDGAIRARHRLVAETLMEKLQRDQGKLAAFIGSLAYAVAVRSGQRGDNTTSAFLRALLSHERLCEAGRTRESGRYLSRGGESAEERLSLLVAARKFACRGRFDQRRGELSQSGAGTCSRRPTRSHRSRLYAPEEGLLPTQSVGIGVCREWGNGRSQSTVDTRRRQGLVSHPYSWKPGPAVGSQRPDFGQSAESFAAAASGRCRARMPSLPRPSRARPAQGQSKERTTAVCFASRLTVNAERAD